MFVYDADAVGLGCYDEEIKQTKYRFNTISMNYFGALLTKGVFEN